MTSESIGGSLVLECAIQSVSCRRVRRERELHYEKAHSVEKHIGGKISVETCVENPFVD